MIFIMVGTHTQPFDRLLRKVDELIAKKVIRDDVIAQTGSAEYEVKNYEWEHFYDKEKRDELIGEADLIITHGGAGCIIDSLIAGKPTVVVPRYKKFGEHTNDHQLEITRAFEKDGKIVAVYDIEKLGDAIKKAKSMKIVRKNAELAKRLKGYLSSL